MIWQKPWKRCLAWYLPKKIECSNFDTALPKCPSKPPKCPPKCPPITQGACPPIQIFKVWRLWVLEYFGNFSIFWHRALHMGVAGVTIGTATWNRSQGRVFTISWTWIKFRHEIGQKKANNQNLSLFYQLGQKSSTHALYSGMADFGRSSGPIVAKLGRNTIGMKTNPSQPVLEYFGNF